jgi:hypothetical protein
MQSSSAPMTPHEIPYLEKVGDIGKETVMISDSKTCLAEFRHENAELRPLDFGRSESCET